MEQQIKQLLSYFGVNHQDDINEAIQCSNSVEKWQKFILQIIGFQDQEAFKKELFQLPIFERGGSQIAKAGNIIVQGYLNLKEQDIRIKSLANLQIKEYKWNEKLMNQIHQASKDDMQTNYAISDNLNQFLNREIDFIFDILSRRTNLKEYFDQLKMMNKGYDSKYPIFQLFEQMTFGDFVIYLIKFCSQKRIIGNLLNYQAVPVPILYEVNGEAIYNTSLCLDILGVHDFSLILSIGTPKAERCGKSSFLGKLMSLNEQYLERIHFTNTLNIFTKFTFSEGGKKVLADFNGAISEKTTKSVFEVISNFSKLASLLIIHANQDDLLGRILQTQQYINLCREPVKILILVRDLQKASLRNLSRSIPDSIVKKTMLRCLKNFKEYPITTEHKQELEQICSKSFNLFKERNFSYRNICIDIEKNKYEHYESLIKQDVSYLYTEDYNKLKVIPNICKIEELSELLIKIKEESKSEILIGQYQDRKSVLNSQLKKPQLTEFITNTIKIIQQGPFCKEMLAQKLQDWKNQKGEPLREIFLRLSDELHEKRRPYEQIQKEIFQNQLVRSNYELSVDKIINELVIYNEKARDKKYHEIINRFYRDSVQELSPVNIIDGKTLSFGNYALEELIHAISEVYASTNKKVYVISVIGAQSSAKSTLLNFLFRCKFETSAGRCTKGVYMSLCQIDDMAIVVLDTEGLLSVSARDTAFDHQIATFVLKISNLIIINNKGELTSTLQQMLEVCLYVLQCLHKDEKKTDYVPQKIIFALRDQTKPEGKFQQEMSAQIKNSLQGMKGTSDLDYQNFFSIETDDILSLPNAFTEIKGLIPKVGTINIYDQTFGACILGMRKRIIDYLKVTKPQVSLKHFYDEASRVWQTIQKCGKEIMNFKTINEIVSKKKLEVKYNEKSAEYIDYIQKNYERYFQEINNIKSSKQLEIPEFKARLSQIKEQNVRTLTEKFRSECRDICSNKEWIREFEFKIDLICSSYASSHLENLNKRIKRVVYEQKNSEMKNQINNIINNLLGANISQQDTMQKFRKEVKYILEGLRQAKKGVNRTTSILQVRAVFQNILGLSSYTQLKINHIEDCYNKSIQVFTQFSMITRIQYFVKMNWELLSKAKDYEKLNKIVNDVIATFERGIKREMINKKISLPSDVQDHAAFFLAEINSAISKLSQKIHNETKNYHVLEIQVNEVSFKIILFGRLYAVVEEQIYNIKINEYDQLIDFYTKKIRQEQENLIRIIKYSGDVKKTMNNDIDSYRKLLMESAFKECVQMIEDRVDQLALRLTPKNIFSQAMHETVLNDTSVNKKLYYMTCYKMIKDINKYLFQIMCKNQEISTRSQTIQDSISKVLENTSNSIKKVLSNIEILKESEDENQIKSVLTSINMIGLANIQSKELNKVQMLERLYANLETQAYKIQADVQSYLLSSSLEDIIITFIQSALKDKIIGCQCCCPICGMKCMLEKGHLGNHKVLQNCHSLSAFAGISSKDPKLPVLSVCHSKTLMLCKWQSGDRQFANCKDLVNEIYQDWKDDFPNVNQQHLFQNFADEVKLKKIWANIENVILKTKYREVKPSLPQAINSFKDPGELTLDDLKTEFEHPLTHEKYRLEDF